MKPERSLPMSPEEAARAGKAAEKAFIRKILEEMIRIDSVNPTLCPGLGHGGEGALADHIGERLEELGCEVSFSELGPGRKNVLGRLPGSGRGGTLLLTSHLDTVGVSGMEAPFDPLERDGRLYGRGSCDAKGQIAAMLGAMRILRDSGFSLRGDLMFAGVCDEEDRSIGTESLSKELPADWAIVGEPTELQMVLAHRGFAWVDVETRGVAVHGSLPERGVDAVQHMGRVLAWVSETAERLKELQHPLLGHPRLHAGTISGGREYSTVPDVCRLTLELRTVGPESVELFRGWLEEFLRKCQEEDPSFKATYSLALERQPLLTDENNPLVKALDAAAEEVMGSKPKREVKGGWTDAALLAERMPVVIFGPGDPNCAHASVEWVPKYEVYSCAEILAATAARLLA
ncbi:MAG: M20 family metallopeptidase [Nitrospinota bacterium]